MDVNKAAVSAVIRCCVSGLLCVALGGREGINKPPHIHTSTAADKSRSISHLLEAEDKMENAFAPISEACVKALSDKTYDKRKVAALEIEK